MNIAETIQKNLGYGSIQKVDPNSQEVPEKEAVHGNAALAQAAIPSILLGLYNRLEKEPDAALWLSGNQPTGNLLEKIFGKAYEDVVEHVSMYSRVPDKNAEQEMEHIASECVRVIRDHISDLGNEDKISAFVAKHKLEVLHYLPASLQMGTLLGNNNLDDRTNKMEGPVSSLMNRMEKQFNSSENN